MSNLSENGIPQRPSHRTSSLPSTKTILGVTFGIFMVIIYVGMGVLLLINFFDWTPGFAWARYLVGVILIIYGFFRAWRQYKDFTRRDDE